MATVIRRGMLKPLRYPRSWLGLWGLAIASVIVVCLMPSQSLPPLPRDSDKIQHLLGYFVLAAAAVQIFRLDRSLWMVAVGLVAMGIGIEFAQGALTDTRARDPLDAVANTIGVLLGMAVAFSPWRDLLQRLESRFLR